jgi:PIG-X / PBN1
MPPSAAAKKPARFTATVPLHLRYLAPANASHTFETIPWPAVFFACPSESSGSKLAAAPFDRVNLGYDGLMGAKGLPNRRGTSGANTIFYHVPPSQPGGLPSSADGRAVSTLMVPVLDLGKTEWVEWGTMGAALLGTVWLLFVLLRVVKKHGVGRGNGEKES